MKNNNVSRLLPEKESEKQKAHRELMAAVVKRGKEAKGIGRELYIAKLNKYGKKIVIGKSPSVESKVIAIVLTKEWFKGLHPVCIAAYSLWSKYALVLWSEYTDELGTVVEAKQTLAAFKDLEDAVELFNKRTQGK